MERISEEKYKEIVELMPICCIDIVIINNDKMLLVKRKNEPEKGKLWFPGGRLYKNEKLKDAALRIAKEEVGLTVNIQKMIGAYDYMSDKTNLEGIKTGTHTPIITFLTKLNENQEVELDSNHSDFNWVDSIEENFDPYLKEVIKDSGVFN